VPVKAGFEVPVKAGFEVPVKAGFEVKSEEKSRAAEVKSTKRRKLLTKTPSGLIYGSR
jgi:hypothetical protein